MRKTIEKERFEEERALYHAQECDLRDCTFAGPKDGESVLKEARDVTLERCTFSLRYPLWHVRGFALTQATMDEKTRAALWYTHNGTIKNCKLEGIKAVRECSGIAIENSKITSPEFGWKCRYISLLNSEIESEYLFLDSRDVTLDRVSMKGKYSFQYMENLQITDSVLDTKDAFWHSRNITVKNSVVKGEYLAWFSEGLTLINCKISGTQPFCYCKKLRLINCTMENTDLAFEYSEVEADIKGSVLSIKNPKSGTITVDGVGEVIREDPVMECSGRVVLRKGE